MIETLKKINITIPPNVESKIKPRGFEKILAEEIKARWSYPLEKGMICFDDLFPFRHNYYAHQVFKMTMNKKWIKKYDLFNLPSANKKRSSLAQTAKTLSLSKITRNKK